MGTFIKTIKIITITALMLAWAKIQPVYAASIVVNTNADNTIAGDGFCTLREAINNANIDSDTTSDDCVAGASADIISFAGNYTFTLAGNQLPVVTTTITINGNGATNTILQANVNPNVATNRIFEVSKTGDLTLDNLTVRNGRCNGTCPTGNAVGGGIYNNGGKLTVSKSTISANSATLFAGGIMNINGGILIVVNSLIVDNTAAQTGGGIHNVQGSTLSVMNSTFATNSATFGGAIASSSGSANDSSMATLTNSTFSSNMASQSGGCIHNNVGVLTVTNSTFSSNTATNNGGCILSSGTSTVSDSTFSNNSATNNGGGINNNSGKLTVTNSTFLNNLANNNGGGIFNLFFGTLELTHSTVSRNSATNGGGIYTDGTASIANSTLFMNSASNQGGGVYGHFSPLMIVNSTFSNNSATNGGGIYNAFSHTTLYNTIVANSPSGFDCIPNSMMTANNTNVDTDGSCHNATQATSAQINLQPLTDNGGPTQTMALGVGSFAISAGDTNVCANSPVSGKDQRGVSRPQSAGCDVGAYEFDDLYPIVVSTNLVTNYLIGPSSFTVTFNENVNDPTGNTDIDDVTNPDNYLLVENGVNETFDTTSCAGGRTGDDTQVVIDSVSYNATSYTSAVNINGGTKLPNGKYRLFVCGTTSIVDIVLNPLNNGTSDYTFDFIVASSSIASLPNTGFAPNRITSLPSQPANLAYSTLGDIWLEIPSLNIKTDIVGVPQSSNGWNVDWLGQSAGWLNGTAFPSWEGNSVVTGHVYDANGKMGPFANIKNLKHGDQIIVHLSGEQYIFEVRTSDMVSPSNTKTALEHLEDHSYLTLITCQGYNPFSDSYFFRRVVRAVLVNVERE